MTEKNLRHTGSWVIGDPDFVKKVIARDAENRSRIARHLKENMRLEDVMQKISQWSWGGGKETFRVRMQERL